MSKIFGLERQVALPPAVRQAMDLGHTLEKPIIAAYIDSKQVMVTYPGLCVHRQYLYIVCSPDAVVLDGSSRVLIEVKTSKNCPTERGIMTKWNDQIQANLFVTECDSAVLLFYETGKLGSHTQNTVVNAADIKVLKIMVDRSWQMTFVRNAQLIYTTYLDWNHQDPVDLDFGRSVLSALVTKESDKKKQKKALKSRYAHQFTCQVYQPICISRS